MSGGMMLFVGLVFGAVFMLAQGLIIPAFGDSAKTRRLLRRRLRRIEAEADHDELASLLREKYLRELSPLERQLESLPAMESLARVIEQAGRSILAHRLVLLALILGFIAALAGWTFSHSRLVTLAAAVAGFWLPFLKIRHERRRRMEKFEEQLPDAIDVMKRALRAGHPFNSAMKLVAEDMDAPVGTEFATTFSDINYGNDVRRALLGFLIRMPSVSLMAVVTAVLVQRESGGNLAEIFEQTSQVIRGRFRFQRKVRTLSAEGRLSAWILALVPLVLFGVIWITTPDYLPVLLENPIGQKLIMFAIVMGVVGVLWIRKIIRIEV